MGFIKIEIIDSKKNQIMELKDDKFNIKVPHLVC